MIVLLCASGAHADAPAPADQTVVAASSDDSSNSLRAVVTGLRQSLADNGLSAALNRASDWVKELEVSWTAHRNGAALDDNDGDADAALDGSNSAALAAKGAGLTTHLRALDLGLVSIGAGGNDDRVWALDHAAPIALLTAGDATETADRGGGATSERALASHDLEVGLRVPMLPWNATIAGDHYWWGMRGFGPQVQGSRVALKLTPVEHVEIEGGRAEDTRGNGGFLGLRYSIPLDQPD